MTRLFLRFYLGVIFILIAAWLIQGYVFRQTTVEANLPVVEQIYAGSGRMARDRIVDGGIEQYDQTMEYLKSRFDYPVTVVTREERPMDQTSADRLDQGESVLYYDRLETAIPDSPYLVELGPLPRFDEPSQAELSFALGGVFAMTAFGIAILLRPVIVQLRGVEKTALAIAGGDLSARIEYGRFRHSAPLAGAFNAMADRMVSLLRSQRELLQTVSHELRTPLARIKFATKLIETADNDEQRQQRLAAIDDATDRLDDLVGELLTYARIDAETTTARSEVIDVRELIEEQIELHSPLHPGVQYLVEVEDTAESVVGDGPAIARAVGNLISNAGKHAKSKVSVTVGESDGRAQFVVEDDGAGIPEEHRESVFLPFKTLGQPDHERSSRGGTGLGLALVKRIAERSGGVVSVGDSKMGGARFALTLSTSASSVDRPG